MSRRRNLQSHLQSLEEIRGIMNSMKTLAYTETRKLARFLDAQHTVVRSIENVAADLLASYPETLPEVPGSIPVYIVIGTQRGFCGNFNHALLEQLESILEDPSQNSPQLMVVGHKLCTLVEADERVVTRLDGANASGEVPSVLGQLVSELNSFQENFRLPSVHAIYHDDEGDIGVRKLLPPFQNYIDRAPRFPHPPVLNQSPQDCLGGLVDHYLLAALHEVLYTSLMAENHRRVLHLEGAVKHLDDASGELQRQCNSLRQGEIIEEIEVILLNQTETIIPIRQTPTGMQRRT